MDKKIKLVKCMINKLDRMKNDDYCSDEEINDFIKKIEEKFFNIEDDIEYQEELSSQKVLKNQIENLTSDFKKVKNKEVKNKEVNRHRHEEFQVLPKIHSINLPPLDLFENEEYKEQ